nr:hypothetical protein [Tanacetum cinerariifolium]
MVNERRSSYQRKRWRVPYQRIPRQTSFPSGYAFYSCVPSIWTCLPSGYAFRSGVPFIQVCLPSERAVALPNRDWRKDVSEDVTS